jgi:IS30 family transposase
LNKNTSKETKKYSYLDMGGWEEITIGLENGMKQYQITLMLEYNQSTVSREIKRYNPVIRNLRYRANRA